MSGESKTVAREAPGQRLGERAAAAALERASALDLSHLADIPADLTPSPQPADRKAASAPPTRNDSTLAKAILARAAAQQSAPPLFGHAVSVVVDSDRDSRIGPDAERHLAQELDLDTDEDHDPQGHERLAPPDHDHEAESGTAAAASSAAAQQAIKADPRLAQLFQRVQAVLGPSATADDAFRPMAPETLEQSGLCSEEIERLILKYLLNRGNSSGRGIATQIKLNFGIVDPLLKQLKRDQLLTLIGSAEMGDYIYGITELGRERARRYSEECSYFGAAPVSLSEYLKGMAAQSIAGLEATETDLQEAFSDLLINPEMFERLGPAINSGRGMFLFGEPGNGKTSIAERITRCFGTSIWIPRALGIDGEILRLYDPGLHEALPQREGDGLFDLSGVDPRWIQIVRPTVIVGGELTMEQLEVTQNSQTKICEAPLQLKSNCGTFVIDDFGRQRMPVSELLNRWIVPLEKRYDFLNMPSGKKIQVPFDQLIIFSTNLEPRDLVDGAFLRRIPYKIQVPDPSEPEFREILRRLSPKMGFQYEEAAVDHLIATHYRAVNRPFRSCQPRDLLLQVRNYCSFKRAPKKLTPAAFDFAVSNYFSVM
jgi:DNA-binding PadR family transcriptional regulator